MIVYDVECAFMFSGTIHMYIHLNFDALYEVMMHPSMPHVCVANMERYCTFVLIYNQYIFMLHIPN